MGVRECVNHNLITSFEVSYDGTPGAVTTQFFFTAIVSAKGAIRVTPAPSWYSADVVKSEKEVKDEVSWISGVKRGPRPEASSLRLLTTPSILLLLSPLSSLSRSCSSSPFARPVRRQQRRQLQPLLLRRLKRTKSSERRTTECIHEIVRCGGLAGCSAWRFDMSMERLLCAVHLA